ncbi:hypothetical protein Hc94105_1133 [Helicobacter cinaedi]|uniref:sel1 repeat family protein n=1 Tax=Helicobacter cinaedi TaxID=213 RepID=UPI001F48425C|nr:sel1 repeat family protein [Helicobacter cinaedi]BDB66931.1 hypothetical protein Hc94105_1133 [Helicobacter cinaedi]
MILRKARLYIIGLVVGVATSLIGSEGDIVSPSALSPTPNSEYIAPQIEKSSALVDSTPADSTLSEAQMPMPEIPLESMQTPHSKEITPPSATTPQAQASYNAPHNTYSQPSRELQEAYNAWLNGEFSTAIRLYENACYDGDLGACHAIGTLYFQGSGVAQNYAMSASYYYKACDGGFGQSCSSLGILYHYGLGVRQDYEVALNLYHKSCQAGYPRGCNNLGVMFEEGLGIKRDYKQAGLYYSDACLARDDRACFNIAEMLFTGKGLKKDKKKAMEYYGLSCDLGFQEGCEEYKALKLKEK